MASNGYVVSRPYPDSNVGSNLSSLAGASWLAGVLGRPLIVDWRGMSQVRDESLNYFTEFFEHPAELQGVSVLYAPVEGLEYEPESDGAVWLGPWDVHEIAAGATPVPEETFLVLQPYHGLDRLHGGPEAEQFRRLRSFYREIRPCRDVSAAADPWWTEHLDGRFVVGVNIRTGNGRYFGKGMPYAARVDVSIFENADRFRRVIARAVQARVAALPKALRDDYAVFYATDSQWMSELLATLPNGVSRRTAFPPPDTGDTYRFDGEEYSDRDSIVDTLADMFLLARCDAFVFNNSLFNQYARVVTGHFGGNEVHVERLFLRPRARASVARVRRRLP
jgi:hypothetical protein